MIEEGRGNSEKQRGQKLERKEKSSSNDVAGTADRKLNNNNTVKNIIV